MDRTLLRLVLALLAAPVVAPDAHAQTGTSGEGVYRRGVLGLDLDIEFTGPPLGTGIWLLSGVPGPTTLPCTSPGLRASLEPNLGAAILFSGLAYDASGNFLWNSALPAAPALAGFDLYAQAVTIEPFAPCPVTGISHPLRFSLVPPAKAVLTIGKMVVPRRAHSFTHLPDGRALLAGGENPDPDNAFPLGSLEIYDPLREEFELQPLTLAVPRTRHGATELLDGRILFTGGVGLGGTVLSSAEIYNPITNQIVQVPSMSARRVHHQATLLLDGRVLVTGGVAGGASGDYELKQDFGFPDTFPTALQPSDTLAQVSAELFDPVTFSWQPVQTPLVGRMGHAAVRLKTGEVLIAGGLEYGSLQPKLQESSRVTLWNPVTDTATSILVPELARAFLAMTSKADGGALAAGGGKVTYDDSSFVLGPATEPTAVFSAPGTTGVPLAPPALGPTPGPQPLISVVCVPPDVPNPRYYVIECPDPREVPSVAVPAGLGTNSRAVLLFDETTLSWTQVSELVYDRPAHETLFFEAIDRSVVTGSAWPTPPGTIGLDRTAEVFTMP